MGRSGHAVGDHRGADDRGGGAEAEDPGYGSGQQRRNRDRSSQILIQEDKNMIGTEFIRLTENAYGGETIRNLAGAYRVGSDCEVTRNAEAMGK